MSSCFDQNIHAVTKYGRTLLHSACWNGNLKIAELLLEKGANIHAAAKDDSTPLHYACSNGHLEVAKFLLEKRASIIVKDSTGNIPWDLASNRGLGDEFSELKRKLIYSKVGSFCQTTQNLCRD